MVALFLGPFLTFGESKMIQTQTVMVEPMVVRDTHQP